MKHVILVVVDTTKNVTSAQLAEDIAFTMGLEFGVAGGYIGEPEEHAFYGVEEIRVTEFDMPTQPS